MDLNELIRQHGKSVAFVFKQMELNNPVTAKDIMLVTLMYGQPFVDAVAHQVGLDVGYTNYSGPGYPTSPDDYEDPDIYADDEPTGEMAKTKTLSPVKISAKKTAPGKVWTLLNNILTAAGSYTGARKAAIQSGGGTIKDFGNNTDSNNDTPTSKTTNYLLYAGLALIAVLFVLVIFKNHKK